MGRYSCLVCGSPLPLAWGTPLQQDKQQNIRLNPVYPVKKISQLRLENHLYFSRQEHLVLNVNLQGVHNWQSLILGRIGDVQ